MLQASKASAHQAAARLARRSATSALTVRSAEMREERASWRDDS